MVFQPADELHGALGETLDALLETGLAKAHWSSDTRFTLSYLADEEGDLALESIGDKRAVPVLRGLVQADGRITRDGTSICPDTAPERLVKAKIALGSLEEGDAVPRLCALLGDKSFGEFDRRDVIWRLGDRADPRAIPFLIEAIRTDPSGSVVNQAITVLAVFKYRAAVAGLIECFDADFKGKEDWKRAYEPGMFQDHIAASLRAITGRTTGSDKQQWLDWWHNEGQSASNVK